MMWELDHALGAWMPALDRRHAAKASILAAPPLAPGPGCGGRGQAGTRKALAVRAVHWQSLCADVCRHRGSFQGRDE